LAEKYDVDLSYLCEIASREHWVEERANRCARIPEKAMARGGIRPAEQRQNMSALRIISLTKHKACPDEPLEASFLYGARPV
jgi:hypothetical protein